MTWPLPPVDPLDWPGTGLETILKNRTIQAENPLDALATYDILRVSQENLTTNQGDHHA
jgi:hypothetical protein